MRPLRLLLSLSTSLIALTLLLYIAFGPQEEEEERRILSASAPRRNGRLKALFSFTSPASLFPPSAIISLTDDNSTFFLARPAAFGPSLPTNGLSGPLWIGSGFGDDTMGRGELGCSDVPGWSDGTFAGLPKTTHPEGEAAGVMGGNQAHNGFLRPPRRKRSEEDMGETLNTIQRNDGTDDYLHLPLSRWGARRSLGAQSADHADIQSLQESAEITGKVVMLKRGGCGFLEKAKWAQKRGGMALIVGDDVRGGPLIRMYAHGDTSNITIPAIFTSHTTAHLLYSLFPSGDYMSSLSPEDAAKVERFKNGKEAKKNPEKSKGKEANQPHVQNTAPLPTSTAASGRRAQSQSRDRTEKTGSQGWLRFLRDAFGLGHSDRITRAGDSRRPPSSGKLDWVLVEDWDNDQPLQKATKTHSNARQSPTPRPDDFVIGKQDWRDPDLRPQPTSTGIQTTPSGPHRAEENKIKGGHVVPGSGEYINNGKPANNEAESDGATKENKGWFSNWSSDGKESEIDDETYGQGSDGSSTAKDALHSYSNNGNHRPNAPEPHDGLWVTLSASNMSSSPFFDTLLVLVVSPLVTLTVVYTLLLLRSRIRRRRWRAPKSVVDRLPVRTYHTINDRDSSPTSTPMASSPSTPLLQRTASRPISSISPSRSGAASDVPVASSSLHTSQRTSEEKRESGLAEWRRRYGGRQKECVVCLEEYIDGVSRVMSLPCGHEFHAECITPWLVTRRRTCPICKGDVVRTLSQSYLDRSLRSPSPTRTPPFFQDDPDALQVEAAESRNDSASASRPIPVSTASNDDLYDDYGDDIEANWVDDEAEGSARGAGNIPNAESDALGSSLRDLSSTVQTTIWRGFDAIRNVTGLQRGPSYEEIDRDR